MYDIRRPYAVNTTIRKSQRDQVVASLQPAARLLLLNPRRTVELRHGRPDLPFREAAASPQPAGSCIRSLFKPMVLIGIGPERRAECVLGVT